MTREERDLATLVLLGQIAGREAEQQMAELRHLAAKLAATYGPEPVRVVPAEAVVDTGEHEPEDDGGPTDEEIDEAAKYAALVDFSHMTRAFRRVKGGAA
jgi:hypothetical protein